MWSLPPPGQMEQRREDFAKTAPHPRLVQSPAAPAPCSCSPTARKMVDRNAEGLCHPTARCLGHNHQRLVLVFLNNLFQLPITDLEKGEGVSALQLLTRGPVWNEELLTSRLEVPSRAACKAVLPTDSPDYRNTSLQRCPCALQPSCRCRRCGGDTPAPPFANAHPRCRRGLRTAPWRWARAGASRPSPTSRDPQRACLHFPTTKHKWKGRPAFPRPHTLTPPFSGLPGGTCSCHHDVPPTAAQTEGLWPGPRPASSTAPVLAVLGRRGRSPALVTLGVRTP